MLKKNPETYNEIVHYKKMMDLVKYYQLSEEVLNEISDFILADSKNSVECSETRMYLKQGNNVYKTFNITLLDKTIDGLILSLSSLVIIPHYSYSSSRSGSSSSSSSSGGGSSNNNNYNNYNNNNNYNLR